MPAGCKMRIIVRHNLNLDKVERALVIRHAFGTHQSHPDAVTRFEREFADKIGVRHGVAMSSGRAALWAILKGLGVADGDEVIVPAYSFFTIPDVVRRMGAIPVFAPCHPTNHAIDPTRLTGLVGKKTVAVIVEHPFGQPAPVPAIISTLRTLAPGREIPVIEDPSQSIGATLNGRQAGAFGHTACCSFVRGKNLTTMFGGMVVTNDANLAEQARRLVNDAPTPDEADVRAMARSGLVQWALTTGPGFKFGPFPVFYLLNAIDRKRLDGMFEEPQTPFEPSSLRRMSAFQAELGLLQLGRLDLRNTLRRTNAEAIMRGLANVAGLELPTIVEGGVGTYNALPVRVRDGSGFATGLMLRGVDTRADYMSVFLDPTDSDGRGKMDIRYLPNHPGMTTDDVAWVVSAVRSVAGSR